MWPFIPRVIEKFLDLANLKKHNDNYNDIKSALEDLAGTGRTNQTIKGNADAVAAHLADTTNPHAVTAAQVGAYTKTELQTSGQSLVHWDNLTNKPNFADARWKAPVADKATLDTMLTGNTDGDVRLVLADEIVYQWDAEMVDPNKWTPIGALGNGLTSHSTLKDLVNDDHPQYLRTDGTRAYGGPQDFAKNQAKNFVFERGTVFPADPVEAQPFFNDTDKALYLYKGAVQGWVDISGKGAIIRDQEFTALAGQTVFDITVGQYEINTNAITVYKKNAEGKFELVPEIEYTETSSTNFTLVTAAVGGEVYYVKFFENSPEVINQSVKRDGTLQANLNSDMLDGQHGPYYDQNPKFDPATGHKHTGAAGDAPQIGTDGIADGAITAAKVAPDVATQTKLNTRQIENIGYGVQTGLEIIASATPDMNVNVQSGVIYMPDGQRFQFDVVTVIAVSAADATNPRKDIVYVSSAGAITYLAGTPSATPADPALPSGAMKLCVIDVPAGDTAIEQAQITDSRTIKKAVSYQVDLDAKMNATTGHKHTGAAGDAPQITSSGIANGAVGNAQMAAGAAIANIGYTPVNKAGDTMTGNLDLGTYKISHFIGQNLIFNPSFALGYYGWTGIGLNGFNISYGNYGEGGYLGNLSSTGANSIQIDNQSMRIPATAGVDMVLSGEMFAGGVTAGSIGIQWWAFDSAGVALSGGSVLATNGSSWRRYSVAFTTPANTASVRVACFINANTTNTNAAWRKLKLEEGTFPTAYSDNSSNNYLAYPKHNWVSAFRAYSTTVQSIAAATFTKVIYDAEVFDNQGEYDPTISRFTAKQAGIYQVSAGIFWAPGVDGDRVITNIYVNGIEHTRVFDSTQGGANDRQSAGSAAVKLAAGDYLEIFAWTKNALDTKPANRIIMYFTAVKIA